MDFFYGINNFKRNIEALIRIVIFELILGLPINKLLNFYIFKLRFSVSRAIKRCLVFKYSREVWIFDAAELKKGPICKLHHPDMQFSFTIHSVWIDSCEPSPNNYQVDIVLDYMEVLENFEDKDKKAEMMKFMAETVFPNYQKNG